LLILNPSNCGIHLVFSDETDAKKLNKFKFAEHHKMRKTWMSLFTAENGNLVPVIAIDSRDTHMLCAMDNCNKFTFDNVTGTRRFDCDLVKHCQTRYDRGMFYQYTNDARTNMLNVMLKQIYGYFVYFEDYLISSSYNSTLQNDQFFKDAGLQFRSMAFDATNNVRCVNDNLLMSSL